MIDYVNLTPYYCSEQELFTNIIELFFGERKERNAIMIRALGLARVSTTEQSTPDHFSLSHQAGVIRDYTRQHQCDLTDIIQYVQSGGRNRTTLQKVLQRVKRDQIRLVVVAELDRLSRDLVATMSFIRCAVSGPDSGDHCPDYLYPP